jgi:hypothetical protein
MPHFTKDEHLATSVLQHSAGFRYGKEGSRDAYSALLSIALATKRKISGKWNSVCKDIKD